VDVLTHGFKYVLDLADDSYQMYLDQLIKAKIQGACLVKAGNASCIVYTDPKDDPRKLH
jgi:hypothetical protein